MEEPMRKTKMQKRPKSTDTLLKTSKKKDIELTEKDLGKVSGGMKVEMPNVKTEWK
jgi:hypothetical protein